MKTYKTHSPKITRRRVSSKH